MPPARFYVDAPLAVGATVGLPTDVAHHARRVLRLREGDPVVLFDGRGGEYAAHLQFDGPATLAQVEAFDTIERESPLALTLIQALVAADKLDWIVEKAVELGTTRILIVPTQRSVVRLDAARAARRLRHWQDLAQAACCQCGRNRVPDVDIAGAFGSALAAVAGDQLRLALTPEGKAPLPRTVPGGRVALLVGPEGGLSGAELQQAERAGFIATRLGPRIVRTETAGLVALASLQAFAGDLANPDR